MKVLGKQGTRLAANHSLEDTALMTHLVLENCSNAKTTIFLVSV